MRRLALWSALILLLSTVATGAAVATPAHASPQGINWSQNCTAAGNMGRTHGGCVSYLEQVSGQVSYCQANQVTYQGLRGYTLTFKDPSNTVLAGPIVVTSFGGCMSAFAAMKATFWSEADDAPLP
jgi:hypothetical protein